MSWEDFLNMKLERSLIRVLADFHEPLSFDDDDSSCVSGTLEDLRCDGRLGTGGTDDTVCGRFAEGGNGIPPSVPPSIIFVRRRLPIEPVFGMSEKASAGEEEYSLGLNIRLAVFVFEGAKMVVRRRYETESSSILLIN